MQAWLNGVLGRWAADWDAPVDGLLRIGSGAMHFSHWWQTSARVDTTPLRRNKGPGDSRAAQGHQAGDDRLNAREHSFQGGLVSGTFWWR